MYKSQTEAGIWGKKKKTIKKNNWDTFELSLEKQAPIWGWIFVTSVIYSNKKQ